MGAKLEDYIASLEKLSDTEKLAEEVAKKAVEGVKAALLSTLEAGTDPQGKAWAPRKQDGGRAYPNVGKALKVEAIGNIVSCKIEGPQAFGQYGEKKRMVARQMLPEPGDRPESVQKALDEAFSEVVSGKVKA